MLEKIVKFFVVANSTWLCVGFTKFVCILAWYEKSEMFTRHSFHMVLDNLWISSYVLVTLCYKLVEQSGVEPVSGLYVNAGIYLR